VCDNFSCKLHKITINFFFCVCADVSSAVLKIILFITNRFICIYVLINFDTAHVAIWRMHRRCNFWKSQLLFKASLARATAVYYPRIAILISPQLPTRSGNQFWIDQSCTIAMMNTYWTHSLSVPTNTSINY